MSDREQMTDRATKLREAIACIERFLAEAAIFQKGLVCPLPALAAIYWMRKVLDEIEGVQP